MNFSEKDLQQINNHGITPEEIKRQIKILEEGLDYTEVIAPATINNGIVKLSETDEQQFFYFFNNHKDNFSLQKFVPASGAATRMFKEWTFFHLNYQPGRDFYERFVKKHKLTSFEADLDDFLNNFPGFAFYQDLMDIIAREASGYHQLDENEQVWQLIHYTLSDDGLGYARKPKAFIKFHRYNKNDIRTALEEHLVETQAYTANKDNNGKVEFSISPTHKQEFNYLSGELNNKYNVSIESSFQKPETDTVMIYLDNNDLVRDENGNLVFRPGGHGSLIHNIQDLNSDIIFITSPNSTHANYLNKLSKSYKGYVFCEKPPIP